ncbi:para-nitrobenzyl esterase [Modestobacter sp. DSM 44400]|uniref:carboxylesterase/lipase family protein n=1 Tax=Modestobacter sp. DSM 44400 TaxID=1550230 RepID=UPI0008971DB9|nr:carboxylesterase/lipase family protein [Modestobacter sp. DSM 44400]SDX94379.1 para-nitrobenzyl esterase [Modestobacter sp. DSM 44400]
MQLEVVTKSGTIRGAASGPAVAFKGIPYAAPPFGDLRFAAPVPVPSWDGVRDCTEYGPTAPKPLYPAPVDLLLPEPVVLGEDVLNLNVWTPDPSADGLSVLVWIHGGAFVNGSGAVPQYDGTAFARDGVVLVTINYRLGVDGFLHFDDGGPANRGLLDQVAALEWVRDNIAAFGGDPDRVTIAGESAGAMSVTSLLSMPRAAGLFSRAVAQSGAGHHALSAGTARRVAGYLAERLGVPLTREALAAVPIPELVAAQQALSQEAATAPDPARWAEITLNSMVFEPVIDGDVLPSLPITAITAGADSEVDLLVGTNTDEHALFLVPNGVVDLVNEDLLRMALAGYGVPVDAVIDAYRADTPSATPGELLIKAATDWFFRVPAVRLAEARAVAPGQTFMYEFSWPSPQFGGRLGACHALELAFVFDTLASEGVKPMAGPSAPQHLADAMHAAWVAFVQTGDPGWPAYDVPKRPVQAFGDLTAVVPDPRPEQRALWDGVR